MTSNPSQKTIHVLIVDDHPSIRRGLKYMISVTQDIECVGECDSGDKAIELAQTLSPDVIIMDLAMASTDGVTATQAIRASNSLAQVLVLTSYIDPDKVQRALQAGAIGYLMKTANDDEVIDAIRAAAAGRAVLAREATEALIASTQAKPASDTSRTPSSLRFASRTFKESDPCSLLTRPCHESRWPLAQDDAGVLPPHSRRRAAPTGGTTDR